MTKLTKEQLQVATTHLRKALVALTQCDNISSDWVDRITEVEDEIDSKLMNDDTIEY